MSTWMARSTTRFLSVGLVLALLVLVSGFSSAQTRDLTTLFIQEAKLTASDAAEGDYFGRSVSISSDTLVVGAFWDDDNGSESGSAYVFERNEGGPGGWGEVDKLTASGGAEGDYFGWSVSISGDTVVVGAWEPYGEGSAYVFERDEGRLGGWGEVAKLTASDGVLGDVFGGSVSMSGDTVVVGALGDDDSGTNSGSAYLFQKPDTGWTDMLETARLTASDGAEWDYFGWSVSISGDTVVVGAEGKDGIGLAYLFEKPEAGWTNMTETAQLTASDGAAGDEFGYSVSISGDTIVVGARGGDDDGSAYVFERDEGGRIGITETAQLTASNGAGGFGQSVSISGDTVVVDAYLFEKPETGWTDMIETVSLAASDGAGGFGRSVSISGDTVVVGAHDDDANGQHSGSAYVFGPFEPVAWVYLPVVLRSAP